MSLLNDYKEKVMGLDFKTSVDLIRLLGEEELYDVLIFFFLSGRDLSNYRLDKYHSLSYVILAVCDTINLNGIREYYAKYLSLDGIENTLEMINIDLRNKRLARG